jgi:hypothetical protein
VTEKENAISLSVFGEAEKSVERCPPRNSKGLWRLMKRITFHEHSARRYQIVHGSKPDFRGETVDVGICVDGISFEWDQKIVA